MTNPTEEQKPIGASQNKPNTEKSHSSGEVKGRYAVSHVFQDNTLVDMVYVKDSPQAKFAVATNSEVSIHPELLLDKDSNLTTDTTHATYKLIPARTVCNLVDKNFIFVASTAEEYGTTLDLYQVIRTHIQKYVVLEDERFYDVATGYILMTWVFDKFNTIPYLRVVGDLGTGKSRFLEVVGKLCNRSMMASGSISTAAIYRTIDVVQGTLVFDEADFKSSDMSDDIVKLLNGGHKKDTPVIRMEMINDVLKPMPFRVFGPKILGSRRGYTDTALESRCITLRMFPLKKVNVSVHLPASFESDAQVLRNKLLMFRFKNFHQVQEDESSLERIEFPRLKQTALALTSVVKMVGEDKLKSVIGYLVDYEKSLLNTVSTDMFADVLLCIARLMESDITVRNSGVLHMNVIANAFNEQFYDDYAERETRTVNTRDGVLSIPGQRVSARKIGTYVDKLGIAKERDSYGVHIPLRMEGPRIMQMVERYGLVDILNKLREEENEKRLNPMQTPISEFVQDTVEAF